MNFFDWIRRLLQIGPQDNRPLPWPPSPATEKEWQTVRGYRRRFENDRPTMLKADPEFKGAADEKKKTFTPVPLAREMVRLSSALLFSDEPKFVNNPYEDILTAVVEANALGDFLLETGQYVATEGYGALRIIRDEEVSEQPLITWVPADQVIFRTRHGRFITGGYVILERRPNPFADDVYRFVEEHTVGRIERSMYRGTAKALGSRLASPERWLEEFRALPEVTETRLAAPTLYRWNNVPGGHSDLAGLDTLLDRLNQAESMGYHKMLRSLPVTVADRKLADRQGRVELDGIILTGGSGASAIAGEGVAKSVETIQPAFDSEDHLRYVRHVRESILMYAGYSLASWGLDDGGSADSGKALKLRQARTLLTKAGKERAAREAIINAVACACAWSALARDPAPYRPELMLGDGLPADPLEDAQEVAIKRGAEAVSTEQAVRELHPDWPEEAVAAEVARIEGEGAVPDTGLPRTSLDLDA